MISLYFNYASLIHTNHNMTLQLIFVHCWHGLVNRLAKLPMLQFYLQVFHWQQNSSLRVRYFIYMRFVFKRHDFKYLAYDFFVYHHFDEWFVFSLALFKIKPYFNLTRIFLCVLIFVCVVSPFPKQMNSEGSTFMEPQHKIKYVRLYLYRWL